MGRVKSSYYIALCPEPPSADRAQMTDVFNPLSGSDLLKPLHEIGKTLICRVIWAWSERVNLYSRHMKIAPRKTKPYETQSDPVPLSGPLAPVIYAGSPSPPPPAPCSRYWLKVWIVWMEVGPYLKVGTCLRTEVVQYLDLGDCLVTIDRRQGGSDGRSRSCGDKKSSLRTENVTPITRPSKTAALNTIDFAIPSPTCRPVPQ